MSAARPTPVPYVCTAHRHTEPPSVWDRRNRVLSALSLHESRGRTWLSGSVGRIWWVNSTTPRCRIVYDDEWRPELVEAFQRDPSTEAMQRGFEELADTLGGLVDRPDEVSLVVAAGLASAVQRREPGTGYHTERGTGTVAARTMKRADGTIDGGPAGLDYPLYTAAGSVEALSAPGYEKYAKSRDAWLTYLRQRQLNEALGWQPGDKEYGGDEMMQERYRCLSVQLKLILIIPITLGSRRW